MTDFVVFGPDSTPVTGGIGSDHLMFTLTSGAGGVTLSQLTVTPFGYSGTFDVPGLDDTVFTGIDHFTFSDKVGGNDTITTGMGNDTLKGGRGNDVLSGSAGLDVLFGGNGRDRLYGGDDFDQLEGGAGNDRLFGGAGGDSLIGGAGDDRIYGGSGDDFIDGGTGDNLIKGGSGNDFIIAGEGNDEIDAGSGDDFLEISGLGNKTIDGGKGRDTLMVFFGDPLPPTGSAESDPSPVMKFNMKTGVHGVIGDVGTQSTVINIENYDFHSNMDVKFTGSGKNNQVITSGGEDVLFGNGGRDRMFSGGGDDRLFGGRGNDDLDGEEGNDVLRGGSGADTFLFGSGDDVIKDFVDDLDTIELYSRLFLDDETAQSIIENYASVVNGNTVLTFSPGNTLTIEGLTDPSLLLNDIEFSPFY